MGPQPGCKTYIPRSHPFRALLRPSHFNTTGLFPICLTDLTWSPLTWMTDLTWAPLTWLTDLTWALLTWLTYLTWDPLTWL